MGVEFSGLAEFHFRIPRFLATLYRMFLKHIFFLCVFSYEEIKRMFSLKIWHVEIEWKARNSKM